MDGITLENWGHCGLKSRQLRAFVGMGAIPRGESADSALVYCVTVGDEDFQEIHQKDFDTLEGAVAFINARYGDWEFYDLGEKSDGGCGSCSAH